jgi:hypothetical protein
VGRTEGLWLEELITVADIVETADLDPEMMQRAATEPPMAKLWWRPRRVGKDGSERGTRTPDPRIMIPVL